MPPPNIYYMTHENSVTAFRLFIMDLQFHMNIFYHTYYSYKVVTQRFGVKLYNNSSIIKEHYSKLSKVLTEKIRKRGMAPHAKCPNFPKGVDPEELRVQKLLPSLPFMDGYDLSCYAPFDNESHPTQRQWDVVIEEDNSPDDEEKTGNIIHSRSQKSENEKLVYSETYYEFESVSYFWLFIQDLALCIYVISGHCLHPRVVEFEYGNAIWENLGPVLRDHYKEMGKKLKRDMRGCGSATRFGSATYVGSTEYLLQQHYHYISHYISKKEEEESEVQWFSHSDFLYESERFQSGEQKYPGMSDIN